MSRIDDTFGPIPASLLNEWGQDITYIKTSGNRSYNPTTGEVLGFDACVTTKAIILQISPREAEGLYQTTDLKVVIGTAELGTHFPSQEDRIQYTQDGVTREAKIIAITTYRGTNPVLHTFIARPQ